MKKLSTADVYPPAVYEPVRDELRRKIIELKRPRRIALGPNVTVVFENRATMILQVCEMLRAEKLDEPAKIQDELDVYNALLPDAGELAATLFVEITEAACIRETLARMVGIDEHVALEVGPLRVRAHFEAGRSEADRISSVQYLRFQLDGAAQRALRTASTPLALSCSLPSYEHRTELAEATRASLAADLDA